MSYPITDRTVYIYHDAENGTYYLNISHEFDHTGYIRDGDAIVEDDQPDCDYKITCNVLLNGGIPHVAGYVGHDPELPNFPASENPDHKYVFRIFVKENGTDIAWAASAGDPPKKEEAKVKKEDIIDMPIKPLKE